MEQPRRFLVPKYAYMPLIVAFGFNLLVYSGTKWIAADWPHYTLSLSLDAQIPFCPAFISIYILAYLQWCIGYLVIARDSRALCYHMVAGDLVAKLICLGCFLAIPTTMSRPVLTGTGLWETLTRIIYWFDTPVNLFPSIHCLESWICFRAALLSKRLRFGYKAGMLLFTCLVCASTVLVKQHLLLDIAGGILAAEIGLFVSKKCGLSRIFSHLEANFVKKTQHGAGE